ncbi:hypothetical protein H4R18_001328 [Coemansia javaensis]|uniref:Zinc finger CHCC-type domain-containing protein n=1 Tax=Coemansia javaensis TaxID=2761396 RepID=A0A9W8HHH3_9FUNG|nr:hypothetical protein H4R18_001328 [Coemansia javaensis]
MLAAAAAARPALRRLAAGQRAGWRAAGQRCKSSAAVTPAAAATELSRQQAPNRATTWTESQRPREAVVDDPRFVQANLERQPRPLAAIELIAEEPVREVAGRLACCDGGGGPLGHPRVWINLDEGKAEDCGYCGLRFRQAPHHHH